MPLRMHSMLRWRLPRSDQTGYLQSRSRKVSTKPQALADTNPTRAVHRYLPKDPYMISDLVLELDSADSTFVQPLEKIEKDGRRVDQGKHLPKKTRESRVDIPKCLTAFGLVFGDTENTEYAGPSVHTLHKRPSRDEAVLEDLLTKLRNSQLTGKDIPFQNIQTMHEILLQRTQSMQHLQIQSACEADLIHFALKGDAWKTEDKLPKQNDHDLMLDTAGIGKEDPETTTLRALATRFSCTWDEEKRLANTGLVPGMQATENRAIYDALQTPGSIRRLARIVRIISSTDYGCEWLCTYRDAHALRRGIELLQDASARDILKILNALHTRMERRNQQMSPIVLNEALHHALKAHSAGAVQLYLGILKRHEYPIDDRNTRHMREYLDRPSVMDHAVRTAGVLSAIQENWSPSEITA